MRKFDYSFLNNGLLPAGLVNLTANISALKTMAGVRKEAYAQIFTELEAVAKVQSIKVQWNNNTASIIAYIRDDGAKKSLSEVRMYYRTTPSGAWIDGGTMTKSGDTYSYDFGSLFPSGTTVYWMARLTRSGVSQTAFCPAKYYQPTSNPNSTSYPYGYWTNMIG